MWLGAGLTRQVLTSQLTLIGPLAGSLGTTEGLDNEGREGPSGLLRTLLRHTQRPSLLVMNGILIDTRIKLVTLAFLLQKDSILLDPGYFHCGSLVCKHTDSCVCELRDWGGTWLV